MTLIAESRPRGGVGAGTLLIAGCWDLPVLGVVLAIASLGSRRLGGVEVVGELSEHRFDAVGRARAGRWRCGDRGGGEAGHRDGDGAVPVGGCVLVDEGGRGGGVPIRAMSSRVVAPVASARVADRCRRSWNRTCGSLASARARVQWPVKFRWASGVPSGPQNNHAPVPGRSSGRGAQ